MTDLPLRVGIGFDAHAFAVIYNLYTNPIGATAEELVIWPATVR